MTSDNKNKPSNASQQSKPPSSAAPARPPQTGGRQTYGANPSSAPSRPPRTDIIQKRNF